MAPIAVFLPFSKLPSVSPSAPLTWPNAPDLPSRPGSYYRGEHVERFSKLLCLLRDRHWERRRPLGLQPSNERHQPLQPRADVIRTYRTCHVSGRREYRHLSGQPELSIITACFVGHQPVLQSLDALHK